jgi:hypothetical protein
MYACHETNYINESIYFLRDTKPKNAGYLHPLQYLQKEGEPPWKAPKKEKS